MHDKIEQAADTAQNLPHPEILSTNRILCVYKGAKSVLGNSAGFGKFRRFYDFFEKIDFAVSKLLITTAGPNNKLVASKSLIKYDPRW